MSILQQLHRNCMAREVLDADMKSLSPIPCRTAMSLIEVMIVVMVLGIGLASSFSAMSSANATRQRTAARNSAMAEIQSQIEIFQALDQQALDRQFAFSDRLNFPVAGVNPGRDPATNLLLTQPGSISRISRVAGTSVRTTLRFRVDYQINTGEDRVTVYYTHAPRN